MRARPTPRRWTISRAARTACRSYFRARPATLHAAFEGVRFDAGPRFELDLGREGAREALNFAALIERSGASPKDCAAAFGLDPYAASTFGPFPADWGAHVKP